MRPLSSRVAANRNRGRLRDKVQVFVTVVVVFATAYLAYYVFLGGSVLKDWFEGRETDPETLVFMAIVFVMALLMIGMFLAALL